MGLAAAHSPPLHVPRAGLHATGAAGAFRAALAAIDLAIGGVTLPVAAPVGLRHAAFSAGGLVHGQILLHDLTRRTAVMPAAPNRGSALSRGWKPRRHMLPCPVCALALASTTGNRPSPREPDAAWLPAKSTAGYADCRDHLPQPPEAHARWCCYGGPIGPARIRRTIGT